MKITRRPASALLAATPALLLPRKAAARDELPAIERGPFHGFAESLRAYRIPERFRDTKFGDAGFKFAVSEHLPHSYNWFAVSHRSDKTGPLVGVKCDGSVPTYNDLYHPVPDNQPAPANAMNRNDAPLSWQRQWFLRINDLVDNYDLLYTDGGIPFGGFNERDSKDLTAADIRCTTIMGWPERGHPHELAQSAIGGKPGFGKVRQVELLGHKGNLKFTQNETALVVELPNEKPCDYAVTLRIEGA